MSKARESLPVLLKAYTRYYNIKEENVTEPFAAEAEFHSHEEQFFLVKSAKLSEAESREYVFFAVTEHLTLTQAQEYERIAWETGISRVVPHAQHRNTDVTLVVLTDQMDADAAAFLKKARRYKSYKHTFHGWSHYRVIAMETGSNRLIFNPMGRTLKKVFCNIKF